MDDRRRQASYQTQRLENSEHEVMVNCCLGAYPEVWYKFKRFECLSLLNLYYYQHELVSLDEEIFGTPNATHEWKPLDSTELLNLRTVIKEYRKSNQSMLNACRTANTKLYPRKCHQTL